ncbi:thioredoxin [Candidatus Calescamantes bacterium]|nr:thioredoxin [Candidatus Calescamantes bacterium]
MVITLTDVNFRKEVLEEKEKPVLIDFWAPWCGPCMMVSPIVEEISMEYPGNLKVCKVNVDEAPLTSSNYGIMAIPTLMIFYKGKEVERIVGAVPKEQIINKLKPYLEELKKEE